MNRRTACAAGASAVVLGLLAAGPAWAAPSTQVVQGEVLRLVSVADWDVASSLRPGQPVQWDVTVSAEAPDPGTVAVGISASGGAQLVIDVLRCAQEWDGGGCPSGSTTLESGWSIPRDGIEVPLVEMADTEVAHLRLIIALAGESSGSTQVRVHARGAGESAAIGPGDGDLATTGMTPLTPWITGGALALVAAGAALSTTLRRRASGRNGGET
ncbi:LAETG motif-containing sortase-dependent surface protein [Microbacterium sp. NPDC088619]|uniref:LAETG motif-containing sortase-dependent surface protein n=1 Tax=Microbacterium sp. NPDC088619 TaxID=3364196 RepID=UPI00382AAC77